MSGSISPTLVIREVANEKRICCAACGFVLAAARERWKQAAAVTEMQTESLVYEPETGEQADTILRLFSCRGCGALLDTETALQKEPFLDDTVIPEFLQEE